MQKNNIDGNSKEEFMFFLNECEEYGQGVVMDDTVMNIDSVRVLCDSDDTLYMELDTYVWHVKIKNQWYSIEML